MARYMLGRAIATGAFGDVYEIVECLGENQASEGQLVLKRVILTSDAAVGDQCPIPREAKILFLIRSIVRHKKTPLLQLKDFFLCEAGDRVYANYVFANMGTSLAEHMNSTLLDEKSIRSIMLQLCRGLCILHSQNIVHRDIKPQNLLITDGQLTICDFGEAKMLDAREDNDPHVVSLHYRPPEILMGRSSYGVEVDIWSAGCVMAEMFLTRPLFHAQSEASQIRAMWDYAASTASNTQSLQGDLRACMHAKASKDLVRSAANSISHTQNVQNILTASGASTKAIQCILYILNVNPVERPTAAEILGHPFFSAEQ